MADEALDLQISNMRYDVTIPLLDGRVQIEGVNLKPMRIPAIGWSPARRFFISAGSWSR